MQIVTRSGSRLLSDGAPFRVAGANNYYLGFASDLMVDAVLDLATAMGLNTLRTWAFRGHVQALDRTIAQCEARGLRLILPLINYWDDFDGMGQWVAQAGGSGRDSFFTLAGTSQRYRAWTEELLTQRNAITGREYRDEPAILAWELANEPRCYLPGGADVLTAWVNEMAAHLRSIDSSHLVGVGDEGFFNRRFSFGNPLYNGSHGVDCERLLALPSIDFGTCHLYPSWTPDQHPGRFGQRWIREHLEAAQAADKPMLVEEFGHKIREVRNDVFRAWLEVVEEQENAGALTWMIASRRDDGTLYPDYDGYTIYDGAEVSALVSFAERLRRAE